MTQQQEAVVSITAAEFFNELVPRLLKAFPQLHETTRGTCQVALFGEQRQRWTIDLGRRTVQAAPSAEPDVYLELDETDFQAMLLNRLDWEEAVIAGRIRFSGRLSVLTAVAAVLESHSAAV